jgi:cytochrome c oxidase cbb3-type subunit 3
MSATQETLGPDTGHDYDGIRELDNPLPRWWLFTLYGTIAFSVVYWFYYHTLGAGLLPMAAYRDELRRAQEEQDAREAALEAQGKGISDEQLAAMSRDPEVLARGAAVFKQNCVACHGDRGQGVVGPNLTDAYWLHGSKARDIYGSVSSGVLDKGMPSWKPVLGPTKVKEAVAYILSIRDSNVPGKAPQGTNSAGQVAP